MTFGARSFRVKKRASLALSWLLVLACSSSTTTRQRTSSTQDPATREPATREPATREPATTRETPSATTAPTATTPRAPDFVTNVELTSPDESEVLGYRVAVYERPSEDLAPRAEESGEDYDAALLFGARVVRDDSGIAIGVSGSGTMPTHAPRTTAPLDGWVFDDGRYAETVSLDARAHDWPAGHVVIAVRRDTRTPRLGAGWSIAIEP